MMTRLRVCIVDSRQYGFMVGRGTEDAINCLIDEVQNSPYKYVMGVFLDISGAFNCACWHQMLEEVERATNDWCLIRLLGGYFLSKMAQITMNCSVIKKTLDCGCPELLEWNLPFNRFLSLLWTGNVTRKLWNIQ